MSLQTTEMQWASGAYGQAVSYLLLFDVICCLFLGWSILLCVTESSKKQKATNNQDNLTDDDTDVNGSNFDNDDESYHSRIVDITTMAKQNQSITMPGYIVMQKDHMTNDCITACLILSSRCSPDDIDAVISPGRKGCCHNLPLAKDHDEPNGPS